MKEAKECYAESLRINPDCPNGAMAMKRLEENDAYERKKDSECIRTG